MDQAEQSAVLWCYLVLAFYLGNIIQRIERMSCAGLSGIDVSDQLCKQTEDSILAHDMQCPWKPKGSNRAHDNFRRKYYRCAAGVRLSLVSCKLDMWRSNASQRIQESFKQGTA